MGGGSGDMAAAMQTQAQAGIETARIQAGAEERMTDKQSQQAVQTAKIDQETRLKEAQINADVKYAELKVREKEAKLDFKVAWKEAQNDAIRAESAFVSAQANVMKAETKQFDAETKREKNKDRQSRDMSDYFYG